MPSCVALLFTSVIAACTLSRMTSPSWPVRIMPPRPDTREASMNRMSPPTGVQARPVATPGNAGALRDLALEARLAEHGADVLRRHHDLGSRALGDLHRGMAEHLADLALEVTHAGFAGVALDDQLQRLRLDLGLLGGQAVGLELTPHQIAPRDLQLLLLGVAGEADQLHAVQQRTRDLSSMLAVAMNTTRDRSNGTPR